VTGAADVFPLDCLPLSAAGHVGCWQYRSSQQAGVRQPATFTATAIRFGMALPLFLLLMCWRRGGWPRLCRHDWLMLILAGAGSVGYTVLLLAGVRLSTAASASVMMGTLPAVSSLLAWLLFRERLQRQQGLALLLCSVGALTVSWPADATLSFSTVGELAGNGLILLAVAAKRCSFC
jgi:drug/metabolite transporter (DMT)-like permease